MSASFHNALPQFLLGGAMKAGTTTLHRLLAARPDVYLPPGELHVFCVDDLVHAPDFTFANRWVVHDFDAHQDAYLGWYCAQYAEAQPGQLRGEDAPAYLASAKAAPRIARLLPGVKLVFLLRNPVDRAYSHYWHLVRTGRAVGSFEWTLRYAPSTLLTHGFYQRHLARFDAHFDATQIQVLLFESFVADVAAGYASVCAFLGLPPRPLAEAAHHHAGYRPRWPGLQRWSNRRLRRAVVRRYARPLPGDTLPKPPLTDQLQRRLHRTLTRLNHAQRPYPPMAPDTRRLLEKLYAMENRGLADRLGLDLEKWWGLGS